MQGPATCVVPRHRTRRDRGRCPARITHHCVPTARELGTGAGVFDPRRRHRRSDPGVSALTPAGCPPVNQTRPGPFCVHAYVDNKWLANRRAPDEGFRSPLHSVAYQSDRKPFPLEELNTASRRLRNEYVVPTISFRHTALAETFEQKCATARPSPLLPVSAARPGRHGHSQGAEMATYDQAATATWPALERVPSAGLPHGIGRAGARSRDMPSPRRTAAWTSR